MTILEMENVSTKYGQVLILQNIEIKVEEKGICILLGSNGAGKTTLINTIIGLVKPVEGTVKYKGENITGMPPHHASRLGISISPEGRRVFPEMTVKENLRMGWFHENEEKKLEKSMQMVFQFFPRLEERKNQLGGTLSGGEQGMLALGRAMMGMPKLVMLDEPSLGLQPNLVRELFEIIKRLNEEREITILLAEQNAKQSLQIAHYGYLIQKGTIIAQGSSNKLAQNEIVKNAYLKTDSSLIRSRWAANKQSNN